MRPTRPRFSDPKLIKRAAERNVQTTFAQLKRWWVQKYKLPSSHDLFQNQSMPELLLEWYEDLYDEKLDLETSLQEGMGDDADTMRRLAEIQKTLGDDNIVTTGDPLVDHWEAELRAGRTPDLDMTLEDLHGRTQN